MSSLLDAALTVRQLSRCNDAAEAMRMVADAAAAHERRERERVDAAAIRSRSLNGTREMTVSIGHALDADGRTYTLRLRERDVRGGGHWLVTGATGGGKSYLVLSLLMQLLRHRQAGIVVIDMKGELAALLRNSVLPGLVATLPGDAGTALARRIVVIAPFDDTATPPFQILTREPNLPIEVQAHEVAASFGRTIGNDLGVLQQHVLRNALMLAINVGLTFPEVAELLRNQDLLRGALARCTLPDVESYFKRQFSRERSGSITGLLSRLDSLVMVPSLRRMLTAPSMVRFDRLIERAVTIIDLGGAPAGLSELGKFFGQVLFGKVVRAIFTREVTDNTPPATIIADEFQQLLMPEVAREFERVLTLARSQRVFLWAMFQQAAQVESASPVLLRILRTNTNYQVLLRSDLEDARHLAHMLPISGTVPKETAGFPDPRTLQTYLTPEEERRRLLERVPSLPDRTFWFWDRRAPHPAVLVRSPTLDLPACQAAAKTLPMDLRRTLRNGVLALSPQTIDEAISARARHREALMQGRGRSADAAEPLTGIERSAVDADPPSQNRPTGGNQAEGGTAPDDAHEDITRETIQVPSREGQRKRTRRGLRLG